MKSNPFLTATEVTQTELSLLITLLEMHLDEGVVDEEIELYSSEEVGDLWLKLAGIESQAAAAAVEEESNGKKTQTTTATTT
jgi:hypothetical protein